MSTRPQDNLSSLMRVVVSPQLGAAALVAASMLAPAVSLAAPQISLIDVTPSSSGATIEWMTDEDADAQVFYGTTAAYTASTTVMDDDDTEHSVMLSGLSPSTMYHFSVYSTNDDDELATSSDMTFTTLAATTGTTTSTTTDDMTLEERVEELEGIILWLQQQITLLLQRLGSGGGNGTATTTPPTAGGAMIEQHGKTYAAGSSIDFSGRYFMPNQNVIVSLNGQTLRTAYADGGGNFTTGSMSLPSTAGTYTYHFAGSKGDSVNATITVK
jgi:hypothetical protein